MAATAEGTRATARFRAEQIALRASVIRRLITLWRVVDPTDLRGTIGAFAEAAATLAQVGHGDSAVLAQRYLRIFRMAEGVGAGLPPLSGIVRLDASDAVAAVRAAALSGIVDARRQGASLDVAGRRGFVRTAGELTKLVLAGGRMTLIEATRRDPRAMGWQRVTSGDSCVFCRMLASRGAVYKSERSADFEAHGSCACTVEPVYRDSAFPEQAERYLAEYTKAQAWARSDPANRGRDGNSNPGLNAYRRWLAAGSPEPGA